jgi:hypothetical protein
VKNISVFLATAAFLAAGSTFVREAQAAGPVIQVVEINGHRTRFDSPAPAFVRYLLIDPSNADPAVDGFAPLDPIAVLMLFTGGDGRLNLALNQQNTGSPNFLVRTRYHFAAEHFVVAVVDAASDFLLLPGGLTGHRLPTSLHGDKYLQDLTAVMNDLRGRYPVLPVWAVGTSRGTVSAAVTAVAAMPPADGVVLTSSLTGPDAIEDLSGLNLESVVVPALIVSHKDDGCPVTRPEDSRALKGRFAASPRVRVTLFHGGSTPVSDPCDPLSPHGYFGIEQRVIEAVAKWIKRVED